MSEKDVIKETRPRMDGAVEDWSNKLPKIRTWRAAVSPINNIKIV
jgi:ribosome recycling factor